MNGHTEKPADSLTFNDMVNRFKSSASEFPGKRTGGNPAYSMEDAAAGAFPVFFTQSPPFPAFQRTMEQNKGESGAGTSSGMDRIPCDNHIRELSDGVHPSHIFPMSPFIPGEIAGFGCPDIFRSVNSNLLTAPDGTHYFSSDAVCCGNCSATEHRNGRISYPHSAAAPVTASPGNGRVISLEPEFIMPRDGHRRQDCENTAAERRPGKYGKIYSAVNAAVPGDDLCCRRPICEIITEQGLNFIPVCRPDSHKTLCERTDGAEGMKTPLIRRRTGKRGETDTCRFISQIPLCGAEKAPELNRCGITAASEDGRVIYKNSSAANHGITEENVNETVTAGRSRRKTENGNSNVLKTGGCNPEHNSGRGKNHLSLPLPAFNLPASLFHTAPDISDNKYKMLRKQLPGRKTFSDGIRALTRYICSDSRESLPNFMIRGLEPEFSDTG